MPMDRAWMTMAKAKACSKTMPNRGNAMTSWVVPTQQAVRQELRERFGPTVLQILGQQGRHAELARAQGQYAVRHAADVGDVEDAQAAGRTAG